jgi:DNA polymerase III gamma/tau subunit
MPSKTTIWRNPFCFAVHVVWVKQLVPVFWQKQLTVKIFRKTAKLVMFVSSCTSFNENASFNIHEIDAASNNSVEDIRSLVEQVRYAPASGKFKIYIVDEVHMLSASSAFNAFLKTLEEPPPICKIYSCNNRKT